MQRRPLLKGLLAGSSLALLRPGFARAADTPGVTATEIKIGNTDAYSGPASAYSTVAKSEAAYFQMLNDKGGINGRKITFISYDDGYSPPRTVEQTRKLVEQDEVAFLFNGLGTPTNSSVQKYLNGKKVPQLFVSTGADKWGDYQHFPWTIGYNPSYRTEGQIYAKYIRKEKPDAKVSVLYQNDDFGKDYVAGLKDGFGADFDKFVVKAITYEVTDPTIDSQIVTLQGSGADALVTAATPKFAAQVIRKVAEIGWKPLHFLTNVSISVGAVIQPAGPEKAVGIVSAAYVKDSTDKRWDDDPGMKEWRAFMAKYMPDADLKDGNLTYGYGAGFVMEHVLRQCGDDLSRENIMKQAANIHELEVPVFFPGIKVSTSPTNFHPIRQLQLVRYNGVNWEPFGEVIAGSDV